MMFQISFLAIGLSVLLSQAKLADNIDTVTFINNMDGDFSII